MIDLRGDLTKQLTPQVMDKIRKAPKPTPVAEALAVTKEFQGRALSLEEIAEIVNLCDPGRDRRAKASDFNPDELNRHPELLLVRTPRECMVRYRIHTGPL
jgi:hypothetical protein